MLPTRPLRVVIAAALAVVAIACGDPTKPVATIPNIPASYSLFALTGAPLFGATAISFANGAKRTDAGFGFDVAFDLNAAGQAVVYPVRAVAGGLGGTLQRVGLQVVPGAFDAIREVPAAGYDTLKVQTLAAGTVLAVELPQSAACLYSLGGQSYFAKLVVDSVQTAPRRIYVRTVLDANCGYRQVMPDSIPTN